MQDQLPLTSDRTGLKGRADLANERIRVSESRYRRLFETAHDGILLLNADTAQIDDVNPYLIEMLGYSHKEFLGKKLWEVGAIIDTAQCKSMFVELQTKGSVRYDDLPLKTSTGKHIDVEFVSNSYDCEGIKVIQCNIRDITERKISDNKLQRQTKLYSALSHCNKAIVRCTNEDELFHQICQAAVRFGGMKMAWVGMIDPKTHRVRPVASFGDDGDYIRDIDISVDAESQSGSGPTGTAIRENQPYWCQDYVKDPATAHGRERGRRVGIAAIASLPLTRNGSVVGVFNLCSDMIDCFDELTKNLLIDFASDISFALDNFDRDTERMQALERLCAAEQKFHSLVEHAIAGIFIIQDGILVYVNPRFAEIVGEKSVDTLIGTDLFHWVSRADRDKVSESLRNLLHDGETSSVAFEYDALRLDGTTVQVGANATCAKHEDRPALIGMLQDISEKTRADEAIRRYVAQLKTALKSTVEVATTISEMRDPYTAGHERRVAEIAVAIGIELGFDVGRQEGLQVAGHLHDVGKIIIPSEILSKPGKLSSIEYQLVQGHALASCNVLKGVEFPWPVAQVALQHHERMDGSGYPQGLRGDEILFEARIVAVADVVEAMSSHRPYRPGLGIEKALAEIERGRGSAYDADVADACLRLFREKRYELPI